MSDFYTTAAHVVPETGSDERMHVLSDTCWCRPTIDTDVWQIQHHAEKKSVTTLHRHFDRYADWTFSNRGLRVMVLGLALMPVVVFIDSGWLSLPFIVAAATHFWAGWHGIDRAFPRLPDAPTCCVADRRVHS